MYPYFSNSNIGQENKNFSLDNVKINFKATDDDLDDTLDDDLDDNQEEDFKTHIINSIKQAIIEKNASIDYYDKLSKKITDEKDKSILRQIYLDEKKQKSIFQTIYKLLTGLDANFDEIEDAIDTDDSLAEQFFDRIEDKFENIDFFRMLMSVFSDLPIRDMLYEILVGEQKHAQQLSNLYNKYK